MRGMDRHTGQLIEGAAHLRQSIQDILETPIGSRVENREYGSRLFELVDSPVNQRFQVEVVQAVAEAVNRWEPRFELRRVKLVEVKDSGPVFDLYGVDRDTGQGVVLERI